jgi:hypothetical protein
MMVDIEEGVREVRIRQEAWRILVGIAWVVGTLFICIIGSGALTCLPVYLWNDWGWRWSDATDRSIESALDFMSSVGTLIFSVLVAVLAIESKLPGTRRDRIKRRGFPIQTTSEVLRQD